MSNRGQATINNHPPDLPLELNFTNPEYAALVFSFSENLKCCLVISCSTTIIRDCVEDIYLIEMLSLTVTRVNDSYLSPPLFCSLPVYCLSVLVVELFHIIVIRYINIQLIFFVLILYTRGDGFCVRPCSDIA